MAFDYPPILIRGGGDLATGVAYRLHQSGFPVIVLELSQPLVVRRRVALASAVLEGEVQVEELHGRLVSDLAEALELASTGLIPVLVSPELPAWPGLILVDARMAKQALDTRIDQARLVIGLGPGFSAGRDCHAVIETQRGHRLGRVIWQGEALPNTGTPGRVGGKGAERVLRAPAAGRVEWQREIGDLVGQGDLIGAVAGRPLLAPFEGVLRGLIMPGSEVPAGLKIGDLDARGDVSACFTISDKALAIGGGVLEAVLSWLSRRPAGALLPRPGRARLSPAVAFRLAPEGEVVSIVGGGGKSSLMFALAQALPGPVVTTTTTRIFAVQMKLAPAVIELGKGDTASLEQAVSSEAEGSRRDREVEFLAKVRDELGDHLARFGHCLVVGRVEGEKAAGVPPELPGRWITRGDVATVLVEADGSRRRPCKAPGSHEPVIPAATTLVVPVAGIDSLAGPLAEKAHRPELVGRITGLAEDEWLDPAGLAALLTHPEGGLKGVPAAARVIPFINKVEGAERLVLARRVAAFALRNQRVERVVLGALRSRRPVREIHRRVTAVVLAAGQSVRMGRTKQLLPWGDSTVIGQTINNLQQSAVHDIILVTGHEAAAVEAAAREAAGLTEGGEAGRFRVVTNRDYVDGEMLSSLQVALGVLPVNREAVLVILADQPMVEPESLDRILEAYWQARGELLAPVYQGRRGNPVLIGRPYFDEVLALPQGSAPRALLQHHPHDLVLVDVDSDAVLRDLDRLETYERWRPEETAGRDLTGG